MIARILRALSLRRAKPVEDDPYELPDGDWPHVPMTFLSHEQVVRRLSIDEQIAPRTTDPDAWWRNPFEPSDITNEQGKRR